MRSTLAQAKTRCAPIANLSLTDARLTNYINEAQEELLRMGRWWGTYQRIAITATEGLVTWPRIVANVEAVDVCNRPVYIKNGWYEFMEESAGLRPNDCCGQLVLIDREPGVLASDISGDSKKVRFYPRISGDAGKKILVQGLDANGVRVRTLSSGVYIDGEYVTLVYPFAVTASIYTVVDGLQKDLTKDQVIIKEYDTIGGTERQIGILDADETVVSYRRSFLDPFSLAGGGSCTADTKTLTAIVKLAYRPAINDTDYLIIGNLGAIKDMVQSIKRVEGNQDDLALVSRKSALAKLNHELRTMTGDKVEVKLNTQGTANLRLRSIGRLT